MYYLLLLYFTITLAGAGHSSMVEDTKLPDNPRTIELIEPRRDLPVLNCMLRDSSIHFEELLRSYSTTLPDYGNRLRDKILLVVVNTAEIELEEKDPRAEAKRASLFVPVLALLRKYPGTAIMLDELWDPDTPIGTIGAEVIPNDRFHCLELQEKLITLGPPFNPRSLPIVKCFVPKKVKTAAPVRMSAASPGRDASRSVLMLVELLKAITALGYCIKPGELGSMDNFLPQSYLLLEKIINDSARPSSTSAAFRRTRYLL